MPIHVFTEKKVQSLVRKARPGIWSDGGNLSLQIPRGQPNAYWLFLYRTAGVKRTVGLGPVRLISLAEAREKARELAQIVREGRDPKAERGAGRMRSTKLAAVLDEYFALQTEARRREWQPMMTRHCAPIAEMPVCTVSRADIASVLRPIWETTHSTATRLQARLENVFEWAEGKGYRTGNPARWKAHLEHDLPRIEHVVKPMDSMPFADVPAYVEQLRAREGNPSAEALLFTVLTACRMGNVSDKYAPRWDDIDWNAGVWNVCKIKTAKEGEEPFPVPLSKQTLDLLHGIKARQAESTPSDFIFASSTGNTGMKQDTIRALHRTLAPGYDVHGFRGSFRTWTMDLDFDHRVVETCMMHHVVADNKAQLAYLRGTFLEKRRRLMQAWADHCFGRSNVVKLAA